jgi:DNA repair protein RadC
MALARRLVDGGTLIGVDILDHIVIGEGRYVSFRQRGWL